MQKRIILLVLLLLPVVLLAACQSTDTVYKSIREATLRPGDAVPAPTGPVVLTVTGKLGTTNAGDTLQFDMQTLERLGLVEYVATDKYQDERSVTFRGVLLADLLKVAGADAATQSAHLIALDGYEADVPQSDIRDFYPLIATSSDGQPLDQERFGQLRVVYPNQDFDFDAVIYADRWVWSLATIDIR